MNELRGRSNTVMKKDVAVNDESVPEDVVRRTIQSKIRPLPKNTTSNIRIEEGEGSLGHERVDPILSSNGSLRMCN